MRGCEGSLEPGGRGRGGEERERGNLEGGMNLGEGNFVIIVYMYKFSKQQCGSNWVSRRQFYKPNSKTLSKFG